MKLNGDHMLPGDPSDNKQEESVPRDVNETTVPESRGRGRWMIRWEDNNQAEYFIGTIGPAKFEINGGVGGMFGAVFSFAGDCYAVLSTAKTVGEAKRFCEWIARSYGLDRITDQPTGR
jgi:hypothetical protein